MAHSRIKYRVILPYQVPSNFSNASYQPSPLERSWKDQKTERRKIERGYRVHPMKILGQNSVSMCMDHRAYELETEI